MRKAKGIGLKEMVAKLQGKRWDITEVGLAHLESGRRTLNDVEMMLILRLLGAKLEDLEK